MALGAGAAAYFSLLDDPPLASAIAFAGLALALGAWLICTNGSWRFALALVAFGAFGFAQADLVTHWVAAPVYDTERSVKLWAIVEAVEDRDRSGLRLLVQPRQMEPAPKVGMPLHIRMTVRGAKVLPEPGDGLLFHARLMPPSPPQLPGGYDFARTAWFQQIGATGFSYGAPEPWPDPPQASAWARLWRPVETLRLQVSQRIRSGLQGDAGGIAAALIVGDRGGIGKDTQDAMRAAGLSHILSISGLHMSLVAAAVFGGLRLLMALVPPLALTLPTKKIAAVAALLTTVAYFVISGMDVPSERSTIMVVVALLAVVADRQALSMRVIAVAALLTLILSPQAVMDPGAQMSFAAVVALLAANEARAAKEPDVRDAGDINWFIRLLHHAWHWTIAAMATSFIAGLATTPIALYHFGRLAPLSVLANLTVAPVVGFLIMPMALLVALAMPLGLEHWPLQAMGYGIDMMIAVARIAAEWTPSGGYVGRPSAVGIALVSFGGLWLCLWTGRKRWAGVALMLVGVITAVLAPAPGGIVSGDGRLLMLRDPQGTLHLVGKGERFASTLWLSSTGSGVPYKDPSVRGGVACDSEACVLAGSTGNSLAAVVFAYPAFSDECGRAKLIVSALDAPAWCKGSVVLSRAELDRSGAQFFDVDAAFWGGTGPFRYRESARVLGDPPRIWYAKEPPYRLP
ncbi:ComEC/Rec2 family competence protein [Oryzibacter oryziterrae]|uniref:ComEC/Rec2 family competence protein n=1 Tax=Oryzibacter oryziterrae TaxID=2766474 RepID=UPI001F3A059E|nr:ComEC/Rec2 family competence protein [Oryzibacter oryziterrae]